MDSVDYFGEVIQINDIRERSINKADSDLYVQRLKRKRQEQEHPHEEHDPMDRPILYTEPLPPNTDHNVFQYVFGASCSPNFFGSQVIDSINIIKTIRCHIPWEEARFLIEKKHGMFSVQQRKSNLQKSYIQGFLWDPPFQNWRKEAKVIPKDRMMTPTDRVIVIVKPLPQGLTLYIPERFRTDAEEIQRSSMTDEERKREEQVHKFINFLQTSNKIQDNMSEEEKIVAIMDDMDTKLSLDQLKERLLHKNRKRPAQQFHPSDLEMDPTLIKPPPDYYVCHRCGKRGHWKHMCPSSNAIGFVPVTQPPVPTGIPKSMLREAKTDEERKTSMVADDGRLVVLAMKPDLFTFNRPSVPLVIEEVEDEDDRLYYEPIKGK